MSGRLDGKAAIVCGAGQSPGETIGNGRATAILFAREGAQLLLVDRRVDSAEETAEMIRAEGGVARVLEADITRERDCSAIADACVEAFGTIDVLHNNVGIGGGSSVLRTEEQFWDNMLAVNLKGMMLTCKHVLPVMRERESGSIVNISSVASVAATPMAAYKVSKAGVNALTQNLAMANARYGIRVNAILPGLMDTPMAVDASARVRGVERDIVAKERDSAVPLLGRQGTGWDIAHAALFLASDEAKFVTGVLLPVDGGQSCKVG